MTSPRRCCPRAAAVVGVGLVLVLGGHPATGQETLVAEPTTLPSTTLPPTTLPPTTLAPTTVAPTTTTAPVTSTTEAITTTTVAAPTTTAESATTTTGAEQTTTTTAEGTATTRVTSTSVPGTAPVAGTTRRDAELARGRAVALQRNARARQVGGVVEPTGDAPDLGSLFDRPPASRGRSTQERSGSGLFFAGLAGAVVAGLALGLRDRSVTLSADPA